MDPYRIKIRGTREPTFVSRDVFKQALIAYKNGESLIFITEYQTGNTYIVPRDAIDYYFEAAQE
jgi:hypothetical protein